MNNNTIERSEIFTAWFDKQERTIKAKIMARVASAESGNFGDYQYLRDGIYEMRFRTNCQASERVCLLLNGGDKNTKKDQTRDIERAIEIRRKEMENGQ